MYYTIGGFTLDDTVLPSGEVRWSAPGGNALYSAIGAKLWGVEVGIITPVGRDYPQKHLDRLAARGFDLAGVRRIDHPSFHVWVLHEGGGRRQIIYRLDSGSNTVLDPGVKDIPEGIEAAQGVHICPILGTSQASLMEYLLPTGAPLFLDLVVIPDQIDVTTGHRADLWPRLRAFLPSFEEVEALLGKLPLPLLVGKLAAIAPPTFTIKMGSRGSLVRDPSSGVVYHIPIYPAAVVDATGAGDAYCGGFMVGLQETGDPKEAALRGTVSASFVIEDFGALHALAVPVDQVNERLESLRSEMRPYEAGMFTT